MVLDVCATACNWRVSGRVFGAAVAVEFEVAGVDSMGMVSRVGL